MVEKRCNSLNLQVVKQRKHFYLLSKVLSLTSPYLLSMFLLSFHCLFGFTPSHIHTCASSEPTKRKKRKQFCKLKCMIPKKKKNLQEDKEQMKQCVLQRMNQGVNNKLSSNKLNDGEKLCKRSLRKPSVPLCFSFQHSRSFLQVLRLSLLEHKTKVFSVKRKEVFKLSTFESEFFTMTSLERTSNRSLPQSLCNFLGSA